ncbi:MAG: S-layer homology domain-containing protein [Propioniciclava sp.]
MTRRHSLSLAVGIAVLAGFGLLVPGTTTQAAPVTDFDPGMIITDALFYDSNAMTAAEVQDFLEEKVPRCEPWRDADPDDITCLKDYVTTTVAKSANTLCRGYAARQETAAEIIDGVARSCGISQKVLLVTLQKEQRLVTHTWPSSIRYRKAMGFGCPDTAPCDAQYYGFFNQVYNAAQQFKRYRANPDNYGYRAGRVNSILYNPDTSCGTKSVTIKNQATAGLYIYTPYTPNRAALDAGYGTGDSCSAYGNRNFFLFYTDWFGPTTGLTVHTSLASAYTAAGGASVLGQPTAAGQYLSDDGGGWTQTFANGLLLRHRTGTSVFLPWSSAITRAYQDSGGPAGSWGWPITPISCSSSCAAEFRHRNVVTDGSTDRLLGNPFYDVSANRASSNYTGYASAIAWMDQAGVTTTGGGYFRPANPVSRAHMALFLYRLAGSTYTAGDQTFTDVSPEGEVHDATGWMAATGITRPSGNTFNPDGGVSRSALATFLYRYAAPSKYIPPATSPFTDVSTTDPFYTEICWLYEKGILIGRSTSSGRVFSPGGQVNRELLALVLHRLDSTVDPLRVGDELVDAYRDLGGSSTIGVPLTRPYAEPADGGGWWQRFENGRLYLTSDGLSSFLPVGSDLSAGYLASGGPAGEWGWPITPVTCQSGSEACAVEFRARNVISEDGVLIGNPFLDVSGNAASVNYTRWEPSIRWMDEAGVTTTGGGSYNPDNTVRRAHMAAFLYRFSGSSYDAGSKQTFTDVPVSASFHDEVEWMAAEGISRPSGDTFNRSGVVNRAAMAAFLYRLEAPASYVPPTRSPYRDISTSHRFYTEICWLYDQGVIRGTRTATGRVFSPTRSVTRKYLAVYLHRMDERGLGR